MWLDREISGVGAVAGVLAIGVVRVAGVVALRLRLAGDHAVASGPAVALLGFVCLPGGERGLRAARHSRLRLVRGWRLIPSGRLARDQRLAYSEWLARSEWLAWGGRLAPAALRGLRRQGPAGWQRT